MDRRLMAPGPQQLLRPNSFIPTSSSSVSGSSSNQSTAPGNNGKLGPAQIQQLALQSQLQAQHHSHAQLHNPITNNSRPYQQYNQYSGGSGPTNGSAGPPPLPPQSNNNHHSHFSHSTLPRNMLMQDGLPSQNNQPPLNTRTLQRKVYPSHHPPQQISNGPDPLYGNLGAHGQHLMHHHVASQHHQQHYLQHHDPPQMFQQPRGQHQPPYPPPPPPPPGHSGSQTQPLINQTQQAIPQIQPVINQIQQQHHSAKILQQYPTIGGSESDGLPSSLVESMRTLFDILDDSKQGRVRLSDIESRWENGENNGGTGKGNTGAEPLIKMGVMGYLRKVTPPDGMLTFDRFCSGLRLALLTNQNKGSGTLLIGDHEVNNSIPQSSTLTVKPMSHNFYANNNNRSAITNSQITSSTSTATKPRPTSLPISTNQNVNQSQMTLLQRGMSRIPGFNQSKVPNSNNGSGTSVQHQTITAASPPKHKFSNNMSGFNGQNGGGSMGTARRVTLNQSTTPTSEQGTTVVMVHQPPPVSGSQSTGTVVPSFSHRPHDIQIGTIKLTKPPLVTPPNGGFTKFKSAQNGSLDNLKTEEEKSGKTVGKLRPPSAPLLDTTDDDEGGAEYYINRNPTSKRERARSGDRALEDSKQRGRQHPPEDNFGKRVVSFVTPRQRTLSMPQLQLSKLNAKSVPIDDDSSPSLSSSSHSPLSSGETKRGALKSSLKSPSSIPTKMIKQKSETMTMTRNGRNDFIRNGPNDPPALLSFKVAKVAAAAAADDTSTKDSGDIQAPPKPPRNNNGLTISVNNGGSSTPDQPLSGSSTTSTINHPSKPEIRQFLQSWKKGVAEKRPSNDFNPPPLPQQPPPSSAKTETTQQSQENETVNNGTVKLRGDKKLNLRRRETARRHTVQAGIDFATLKRLKQLEQERDILQQGMGVIETSKDWYTKEIEGVEDKISILTKGASIPEQWSESLEERLNVLSCRITEINGLLSVLMDGSTNRIPDHMNLQIPSHLSVRTITQLKDQNRQLTQEVSDCSHRVTQLETEKAMLLRQLFHQKSSHLAEETVYM